MKNPYADIIDLPHHVSTAHKQMPISDRAAQFTPFAALTGFDNAIGETGRLTSSKLELDEYEKLAISDCINEVMLKIHEHPRVAVTFFKKDARKAGGEYVTKTAHVKKIDTNENFVLFEDGTLVHFDDILSINQENEDE